MSAPPLRPSETIAAATADTPASIDQTGGKSDEPAAAAPTTAPPDAIVATDVATSGTAVPGNWKHVLALESRDDRWVLAVGLCVHIVANLLLRATFYGDLALALRATLLVDPLAVIIILAMRALHRGLHLDFAFTGPSVATTAVFIVVAALAEMAWALTVSPFSRWSSPVQYWLFPWIFYAVPLVIWSLVHFRRAAAVAAQRQYRRAIAAEAEALKMELTHLRNQLDPHFLFNALNGIASEIPQHPAEAVAMVRDLAEYLRYSLDHRDTTVSSFRAEVDAARAYLDVQKARFGDDLQVDIAIAPAALAHRTPSFLLQPLVENAVKHGLRTDIRPIDIGVAANCDGATLRIVVANTGALRPDWASAGDPGVGMAVLQRRLQIHYPDRHALTMREAGGRVTATLELRGEPCSA